MPLTIALPGPASALAIGGNGTLYVATADTLWISAGGAPFAALLPLGFGDVTSLALTPDGDGLWLGHGSALAFLNLSSRQLLADALPGPGGPLSSLVVGPGWLAAVVGGSLMWRPLENASAWLSASPVPVTTVATDGAGLYAATSLGVVCGPPMHLTLCTTPPVRVGWVGCSEAFGLAVSDGVALSTIPLTPGGTWSSPLSLPQALPAGAQVSSSIPQSPTFAPQKRSHVVPPKAGGHGGRRGAGRGRGAAARGHMAGHQ